MQIQGHRQKELSCDYLQPFSLEELFAESLIKGEMERKDCYRLKLALLSDFLTEDHHAIITRLLYSVRRGRIKIIDENDVLTLINRQSKVKTTARRRSRIYPYLAVMSADNSLA
jgi:hypothetical protein